MVASVLGLTLLAGIATLFCYTNRSFASLTNYLDLDQKTQVALDKMSREVRQVKKLTSFSSTNLTFQDYDLGTLQYVYDSGTQTLSRMKGGVSETLLTGCSSMQFAAFDRVPNGGTYLPVSTTNPAVTKVIELTWNCSRTILGTTANTESMQSARIVIRNK
jgi:hypothetical protein